MDLYENSLVTKQLRLVFIQVGMGQGQLPAVSLLSHSP